jgi:phosphopantothenoylcysteine decarboxylase/phosphopantothenate--cysteine ligase
MNKILSGRNILLGVTGSIAAYKAADIASQLGHLGAEVHVVLTPHAAEFVGAPTFRALTRNPVLVGVFDEPHDREIAHIHLAQTADLVLVAPATANILAKMSCGLADDMLSTLLLATTAPVLVAPAMNAVMLQHPATQANIATLRARGVEFIDPAYGTLACRTEGWGKLADVQTIVQAVVDRLARARDFAGARVLVTAGATREPLDPVRFLSNRSSGKMGYAIAEAAAARGAQVTLISGHASVEPPAGVEVIRAGTTEEMLAAAQERFADCDLFIAAAAPADYAPEKVAPQKIKKGRAGQTLTLRLRETPDVLGTLAARKKHQFVVGFAAETTELLANAAEKLTRKRLDLIAANDVTAEGAGFEADTNVVTLLWPDGRVEPLPQLPKRLLADKLLDAVRNLLSLPRGRG